MEPERDDPSSFGTNKAIPPETVERRDQLGRELGRVWIGVFVVAAVVLAILAWLLA